MYVSVKDCSQRDFNSLKKFVKKKKKSLTCAKLQNTKLRTPLPIMLLKNPPIREITVTMETLPTVAVP